MDKNQSLPKLHRFYMIRRTDAKLKPQNQRIGRNATLGAPPRNLVIMNSHNQSELLSRKLLPRLERVTSSLPSTHYSASKTRTDKTAHFTTQCDHLDFPASPIASVTMDEVESALRDS